MSKEIELLTEIRDLLHLLAEPALAQRDGKFRQAILTIAKKSEKKQQAILLMDGSRTKTMIAKESGIDLGDLSRLVSALVEQQLIGEDAKQPALRTKLPLNFFDARKGSSK